MPLRIQGSVRTLTLSLVGTSEAPRLGIEPAVCDLGAALIGERIGTRVRNPGGYPVQVHTFIQHAGPLAAHTCTCMACLLSNCQHFFVSALKFSS